ncbi:NADPH-dependent FMN reductase [Mucilaginibacter panaciglaebae]|uniref:NADPH-dependent FMN reductase n=1 Tax=Mucilaginibacter panaciglaebae TaxID=502331 RepID=A0ABP7WM70_9SPHI
MKNIVAISGSLRQGSSNHAILKYLSTLMEPDTKYTIYNNLADVPAFDPGLDAETPPAAIAALRQLLLNADGIIICTPEYAFGVPGSLKNMLDWLVSSSTLVDKPVALITASLGGEYAHASLLLTLGALTAKLSDETNLLIQFVRSKVAADGTITDTDTIKGLKDLLAAFTAQINS